jgi:hypothetical protein
MAVKTTDEIKKLFIEYLSQINTGKKYSNLEKTNDIDDKAIFLSELIQTGNIGSVVRFCELIDSTELKQILNASPESMYFGNVLHMVLYSNIGEPAKYLYSYFRECGAIPILNYYDEYPWNQHGCVWTCIPQTSYTREYEEFIDTYECIQQYEFGLLLDE